MHAGRHAVTYTLWGALLGALLPLLATAVEVATHPGHGLGAAALLRAVRGAPVLWIAWTVPWVLALLARAVGRRQDRLVALEAARREGFLKTASELSGAAQALLSAVSALSSSTAGT